MGRARQVLFVHATDGRTRGGEHCGEHYFIGMLRSLDDKGLSDNIIMFTFLQDMVTKGGNQATCYDGCMIYQNGPE